MRTIRKGDSGDDVSLAQNALNEEGATLIADGKFGALTEDATEIFQASKGLIDDGIIGAKTWEALGFENEVPDDDFEDVQPKRDWETLPADPYDQGYDSTQLREDIAPAYLKVYEALQAIGAKLTSSGGRRSLNADVSSNRSATSMHYVGRAIDLFVHSGMNDLEDNPYVVVKAEDRRWVVWARCDEGKGELVTLDGWLHSKQASEEVTGYFVNLTEILKAAGFESIRGRSSYSATNYGASEWWHFQCVLGLIPRHSKWGDELLKIYSLEELESTPPWQYRQGLFAVDWA